MDKFIASFLEEFGPATATIPASSSTIDRFRGKLPDQLLEYWSTLGFSGFGNGRFWITDPMAYEDDLDSWFGDSEILEEDAFYVIARSGFGDLFLWGSNSGHRYVLRAARGWILVKDGAKTEIATNGPDAALQRFFAVIDADYCDVKDSAKKPLFDDAVAKFGPLGPEDVFAFEPSIIAGGEPKLTNIAKRNIHIHLSLLSQFGQREILDRAALTKKAFG